MRNAGLERGRGYVWGMGRREDVRGVDGAHCVSGRDETGDDLETVDVARQGADLTLLDRSCAHIN
jgi:UPF0288 family protein (methanogenesis marker protein 3)